jgi:hypothetical protein
MCMPLPLCQIRIFKICLTILCSIITQLDNIASVVQFLLYLRSHSRTWTNTNTGSQQLKLSSLDRSQKERENRQCIYKRNVQARSLNHCCFEEAISIDNFECVLVASVIQHDIHLRRIVLSPVTCRGVPHFSTRFHKPQDFRERGKMCVLIFSTTFV